MVCNVAGGVWCLKSGCSVAAADWFAVNVFGSSTRAPPTRGQTYVSKNFLGDQVAQQATPIPGPRPRGLGLEPGVLARGHKEILSLAEYRESLLHNHIRNTFLSTGAGMRCHEEIHMGIASETGKKLIDGHPLMVS